MNGVKEKPEAIYANFVAVSNSAYEMRLEFLVESPEQEESLKEVADIRMSPQMAKILRDILTKSIEDYEVTVGSIPIPKSESGDQE